MSNYSHIDTRMDEVEFEPRRTHVRCRFLYNPSTKEFCGRTCKSWGQLLLFYFIYYLLLAGFFMFMMTIFLQYVIPIGRPFRTGEDNMLSLSPGIGFRPLPRYESTLIHFSILDPESYTPYVQDLNAFLTVYETAMTKDSARFASCDHREANRSTTDPDRVCKFQLTDLGPCSRENEYGYPAGKPCVILKLNKVFGWLPELSNGTHPNVKCHGVNPADGENFPAVMYYPEDKETSNGLFNHHFYPYYQQPSYRSPLVAVQFLNLKKHLVLIVECSLMNVNNWAKTAVHFELLMD